MHAIYRISSGPSYAMLHYYTASLLVELPSSTTYCDTSQRRLESICLRPGAYRFSCFSMFSAFRFDKNSVAAKKDLRVN